MYRKVTTLTEFILEEERQAPHATGSFTLLLAHIEQATKIIASHVRESGLVDILGKTGGKNVYGEEVQKLDEFSNQLLVDTLLNSGQVHALASEELPDVVYAKEKHKGEYGDYVVFFDPLDGSSNIDTNNSIGTIFSIYKRSFSSNRKSDNIFQPGNKQIAAGYVIYGPSVMLVYSAGHGVNGFTLDPSMGSFLLSHPNIQIPEKKEIYSINEGNYELYDEGLKKYLDSLKKGEKAYKLRYVGSMVADIHRTLLKGGIFLYPKDAKNTSGKLRLLFEVNPMSFLVSQAGGAATSNGVSPLDIIPESVSHRVPVALGSKEEVNKYLKFVGKE